jgi:RHS repeat-associated protein
MKILLSATRVTLPCLALLLLLTLPARAQMTPFYTETWSGSPFPWSNQSGYYYLSNGLLSNNAYGDITIPTQLMYTGTLPYGWNYSITTSVSCPRDGGGEAFFHYLRGGNYQVQANVANYGANLSIYVYSGENVIGFVWTSCDSITSTITGSTLTVAVGGTTVFSTMDSTYATGGPGVGTVNCWGSGIAGTVLGANPPAPPNPPTNLAATYVYAWQEGLSWSPSTGGAVTATNYNVYRENPGGTTFNNIGNVASSSCSSSCQFTDPAVSPGQTYKYQVTAYGANNVESSPDGPLSVTTASPGYSAPDAGGPVEYATTWGGGPEQIALLTSELGIRIPLPKFQQASGGPGAQMTAAWNSQIWSHDSTGDHFNATDTGYGMGWIFQVAAMYPVMSGSTIDHFELQASSGVIRKLYQVGSSTQYKSQDSSYLLWDYSTRKLTFRDGSVWTFGCNSIGVEQDAGTLYPTQLEDTNGNLITISYQPGQVSSNPAVFSTQNNTSSRISTVQDTLTTYQWAYSAGHVASVSHVNNGTFIDAIFTFSSANVVSPFCTGSCSQQSVTELTQITYTGSPAPFIFSYDASAELTQMQFPYTGYFAYTYNTFSFSNGTLLAREISARSMWDGRTMQTYAISHPSGDSANAAHTQATILDPTGNQKVWNFIYGSSNGWDNGLSNQMLTYQGTSAVLRTANTTWTQDNFSSTSITNPRVCATTTIYDDGQTQSTTESDTDSNGNVIAVRQYAMGSRSSSNGPPASSACNAPGAGNAAGALYRTTTTAYLTGSPYASLNILNRPVSVTVCAGAAGCGSPISVKTIQYDTTIVQTHSGMVQHDPSYGNHGNPTVVTTNGIPVTRTYDISGNLVQSKDAVNNALQTTTFSVNSQAVGATGGGNSASATYNDDLTTNTVTGSNTDQAQFGYAPEIYRPLQVTNPDNSITKYSYSDLNQSGQTVSWSYPYMTMVTSPMGKITQTFLDGFGRTIQVSVKESSSTWSTTLTQYNACSCSATGKAASTSRPFDSTDNGSGTATANPVSGESIYWTTTSNDGLGRPVTVTLPYTGTTSGPAQTSYSYSAGSDTLNSVTIYGTLSTTTDANGKPKRYFYDAFGQLIRVEELNPANPGNLNVSNLIETARYTYDAAGHMTLVQMGRNGNSFTQTRTFSYSAYTSSGPWGLLASATTPEKGTVNYSYNANGTLLSKTDAKGQTLWYAYDGNHRLLTISSGSNQSSATAVTSFTYDTAANGVGKMASAWSSSGYTWSYSYDILGNVNGQALQTPFTDISPEGDYETYTLAVAPGASYTYDSDSKLTGMTAPPVSMSNYNFCGLCWKAGPSYQYTYDLAGRATGLNQWDSANQAWDPVTSNGTYTAAGQLTNWQEGYIALARSYDPARGWMNNLTASVGYPYQPSTYLNMQYSYNSNGQATTVSDNVNPGQAVTSYTYDTLDRLNSATTPNWTLSWAYDQFGNRTTQSGSAASGQPTPPASSLSYNASNQIVNSGYSYDANGNLTSLPAQVQIPVSNPGFESGNVSAWTVWGSATASAVTTVFHSGLYSLSLSGPTTGAGVYQDITGLAPGQQYVASVWVQVASGFAQLYLDDTTGNPVTVSSSTTGLWQYLSLAYTADSTGAIRIHLWSVGGTTYFDDAALTPVPASAASFTYDVFDRLHTASGATYSYDAFGRRIARTLSDGTIRFYFYDPKGRLQAEYNFDPGTANTNTCDYNGQQIQCPTLNGVTASYLYFAGQRVGAWTDRVGSTRYSGGDAGGRYGSYAHYYPYGEEITSTNNDTYKYAQTYRDSDSGLDYAGARYYAGGVGRFLTPDPTGAATRRAPQGWNQYAYAGGDPVNNADPRGTCWASVTTSAGTTSTYYDCEPIYVPPDVYLAGVGMGCNDFWCNTANEISNATAGLGQSMNVSVPTGFQFDGFSDALAALGNSQCAGLIAGSSGASAANLAADLWNAGVTTGTDAPNNPATITPQPNGGYSWDYVWGNTSGGNIVLNGNYFSTPSQLAGNPNAPNPAQNNINVPGGTTSLLNLVNMTLGSSMSATQFGTLVFLHELAHMAQPGQNAAIDANSFNQSIISKCIN